MRKTMPDSDYSQMAQDYLMNLNTATGELQGLRHDLNNHLIVLSGLADAGNSKGISTYIKRIQGAISTTTSLFFTGNNAIDVILNAKFIAAQQQGIRISMRISPLGASFMSSFDAVTIVGNLLDNAIEAVARILVEQKDKKAGATGQTISLAAVRDPLSDQDLLTQDDTDSHICVIIRKQRENVLLYVENVALPPVKRFGTYVSQKTQQGHGLGLAQVSRLVNDHKGYFDVAFSAGSVHHKEGNEKGHNPENPGVAHLVLGSFCATVLLPIPKD